MQKFHGTERDSERQPAKVGYSERRSAISWDQIRDSQQLWETERDLHPLLGTGRDREIQPATVKDSDRPVASPWHWKRQ